MVKSQGKSLQPLSSSSTPSPSPKASRKNSKVNYKDIPKDGGKGKSGSKYVSSRMEISACTINMSGRGVLGLTPKYKVDMVETFLKTVPDVLFLQDSIDKDEIQSVLKKVSNDNYQSFFQLASKAPPPQGKGQKDDNESRSLTGIAWHKEKYVGTPLDLDDERLKAHADWLQKHDLTIVKIDSSERHEAEDVHPSFVAVSWHGADYDKPLRIRNQECDQLFAFLTLLRKNNRNMPLIIGGDFNMDMKSYDLTRYPDFLLVPYRPVSGNLAKDLKNSFVFTMDSLQVTETAFKQHHPDIFAAPFITVKLRSRNTLRLWAIVRIQRAARKMLVRIHERRAGIKKLADSKKRWRRKIEGEDYVSSEEEEEPPKALTPIPPPSQQPSRGPSPAIHDDKQRQENEAYEYRRRKSFTQEGTKNIMDDFYNKPMEVQVSNHRRKKFDELKSVQDRKKESDMNSYLMRSGI